MGKIKLDPGTLLAPVPPVIVTCGDDSEKNLFTVGWTGIINTRPPMTYISVRPERYSYSIIRRTGEFVINLTSSDMALAADLCGMYTGRKRDKAKMAALTYEPSNIVACPSIVQSPMSLECRVEKIIPFASHHVFMAKILCANVKEELIDQNGRLRLDKADLCAYAHGEYFSLGKSLGKFGFSAVKKKKHKKKNAPRVNK